MFCTQCGGSIAAKSRFCNHCGSPIHDEPGASAAEAELQAGAEETAVAAVMDDGHYRHDAVTVARTANDREVPRQRKRARAWTYLLPISCLLAAGIGGAGDYLYQQHQSKQANALLRSGEALALNGKYAEAKAQFEQALELRPTHAVLLADQSVLTDVMKLDDSLKAADAKAQKKQYDQAIKDIHSLQKTIASRDGAIYKKLVSQTAAKEEAFVVGQVKDSIAAKKTVNELLPLLETLKPYSGPAAASTVKNVKQKIVDLSYESSSSALNSRNFEKALAIVADALKQDAQNAKLLGLQKTIQAKQKAFEEAEQKRIEQAVEASTKEDMNNRTKGIQLVSLHAGLNDYGYFQIDGEVKNAATRPISSVTVYYDLKDAYGNVIYHDTVYVTPYYLAIGDKATFDNSYYYDGSMYSVSVTNMEWQLE
ncbi:hypothetical protein GZH47_30300 [Paenibacillus rhizovicinus]|uniref:Uncharacterized protein n=1 Tax=Paenibacillus rhizovicinus TaxID=2704463 RepID=A0A6C0PAI8_9BACL|nr:FxLYD domain-containing protein [Paenibacillus rhizovicinus]QHW34663.1 hypothetical protein GZH47_30300 [Paenibacillus rhizovicinus]